MSAEVFDRLPQHLAHVTGGKGRVVVDLATLQKLFEDSDLGLAEAFRQVLYLLQRKPQFG